MVFMEFPGTLKKGFTGRRRGRRWTVAGPAHLLAHACVPRSGVGRAPGAECDRRRGRRRGALGRKRGSFRDRDEACLREGQALRTNRADRTMRACRRLRRRRQRRAIGRRWITLGVRRACAGRSRNAAGIRRSAATASPAVRSKTGCAPGYRNRSERPAWSSGRGPSGQRNFLSASSMARSLMLANLRSIMPWSLNSQFSLPWLRNHRPAVSCHS